MSSSPPKNDSPRTSAPDPGAGRFFVGVLPSIRATEDLKEIVESMQPVARAQKAELRWIAPESYHVTLKFLGWVRRAALPCLRDTIGAALADEPGFEFRVHGVGAFPSASKAKVLWAGVGSGGREMTRLAGLIDEAAAKVGVVRETRDYRPHLTLARLRAGGDLSPLILPFSEDGARGSRVHEVILFESLLSSEGAHYEAVGRWPLRPSVASRRER